MTFIIYHCSSVEAFAPLKHFCFWVPTCCNQRVLWNVMYFVCDMGNKLWCERDSIVCGSFWKGISCRDQFQALCSLWHFWWPMWGQEHSAFLSQNQPKSAKTVSKCNSPFFMSIVFFGGWSGPARAQRCCHVVWGHQGATQVKAGSMKSRTVSSHPGFKEKGRSLPMLPKKLWVGPQSLRPLRGSENDISLGLEKHMVSQKDSIGTLVLFYLEL